MSEEYLKRFNSYEILDNIFTFLNRKIKIDTVNSWNAPEIPIIGSIIYTISNMFILLHLPTKSTTTIYFTRNINP